MYRREPVGGSGSAADQQAFEASLPGVVGLRQREAVPRKLDLVAVGPDACLLLVEVKPDAKGLTRAGWQAAVHVARPDWQAAWRRELEPVVAASNGMLDGLRMWRLRGDGTLLGDVSA